MAKKFAIYTAVVGHYDEIKQPLVIDDRFDYILFSNDIKEKEVGVWIIKPIPYSNPIQTKIARWVKTHPEELLPEYEASLWMDSNIIITAAYAYDRVAELQSQNASLSTMKHHRRDCVYDELFELLCCRAEHENVVLRWGSKLRKEDYPQGNGLCETGVFFRNHKDDRVAEFDAFWWKCIEEYSRRDQFSVNYALWKLGMDWTWFMPDGRSVYDSGCFEIVQHTDGMPKVKIIEFGKDEAWLVRYCQKHPEEKTHIGRLYYRFYGMPFPSLWTYLVGQCYRFRHLSSSWLKKNK